MTESTDVVEPHLPATQAIMGLPDPVQLSQTDKEAELRWEGMSDAELNAEISAHRASLRQLSVRLTELGVTPAWEGDQKNKGPARPDSDAAAAGEGDETELR